MIASIFFKLRWVRNKFCLRALGRPTWFHSCVKMNHPEKIEIGSRCTLESFVVLDAGAESEGIRLGDGIHIRSGSVLNTGGEPGARVSIGEGTLINYGCAFLGSGGISIGKKVLISPGVVVTSFQHGFETAAEPIVDQKAKLAPVIIEDDVYLGSNVVVCPGVTIGKGAVIGAGSVVTHDIPAYSVAYGVPARIIRNRKDK